MEAELTWLEVDLFGRSDLPQLLPTYEYFENIRRGQRALRPLRFSCSQPRGQETKANFLKHHGAFLDVWSSLGKRSRVPLPANRVFAYFSIPEARFPI